MILPVVPEGTATDGVDYNQKDKKHYVDDRHLLPIALDVIKQSCLARLAIKAKAGWVVIPCVTVWVRVVASILGPVDRAHVGETTLIRWLTAT